MISIGENFLTGSAINDSNIVNLDDTLIGRVSTGFLLNCDSFDGVVFVTERFDFNVFSNSPESFATVNNLSDMFVNGIGVESNNYLKCRDFLAKFPNNSSAPLYRHILCNSTNIVFVLNNGDSFCVTSDDLDLLSNTDSPSTVYTINHISFSKSDVVEVFFVDTTSNISVLPDYCFYNFVNLKLADLPDYFTEIGSHFRGNNFISGESVINIPSSLVVIGDYFYCGLRDFKGVFNFNSSVIPLNSFTALNNSCSSFVDGFEFTFSDPRLFYNTNPNNTVDRHWRNIVLLNIVPGDGDVDVDINENVLIDTNYNDYFQPLLTNINLVSATDTISLPYNNDIPLTFSNSDLELDYTNCQPLINTTVPISSLNTITLAFSEPLIDYNYNLYAYVEGSYDVVGYTIDLTASTSTVIKYNCDNISSYRTNENYVIYISRLDYKSINYLSDGQITYKFTTGV